MAKNTTKKVAYKEPDDYFPKEIRKKYGLGEYAESGKKSASSGTAKKKVKRK